ncbi:peptidylprolyl isomerase [Halopseudomonas yangmingensis]|uniref:Peptidyl-prolyl cis-trans isomerase n=1 Tax=Halopseudomonas yangmingensis TaxID=1720063 RepID=A0A1I4RNJ9_9GAMM|nr:peptidylprolyl isomerase [Halopseudomonas yangmingensis]SFM53774.1 peptidyl-prolyl cis-trans isomerase A (cyclophilin A) [Halopseudomonas yangmingensis]
MLKPLLAGLALTLASQYALAENPRVILATSLGDIELELNQDKAPISVANFLRYADAGHYDGLIFHRVIPGFMIQGGGFTPDMKQRAVGEPIKNEADNGLRNDRYTVAMARTNVVDSATSQFFINVNDNDFLNHGGRDFGYAVFGQVVNGQQVVETIAKVSTGRQGMHSDVPRNPVVINAVRRATPQADNAE